MARLKTSRKKVASEELYRHPRTGEKRRSIKPLWIDRLPEAVRDEIAAARHDGQTWKEFAEAASAIACRTVPTSTLQRWYDLRIDQPRRENPELTELRYAVRRLKSIAISLECAPMQTCVHADWISRAELLHLTGWNERTVYRKCASGDLKTRQIGTGRNGKAIREYDAKLLAAEFQIKRLHPELAEVMRILLTAAKLPDVAAVLKVRK